MATAESSEAVKRVSSVPFERTVPIEVHQLCCFQFGLTIMAKLGV